MSNKKNNNKNCQDNVIIKANMIMLNKEKQKSIMIKIWLIVIWLYMQSRDHKIICSVTKYLKCFFFLILFVPYNVFVLMFEHSKT